MCRVRAPGRRILPVAIAICFGAVLAPRLGADRAAQRSPRVEAAVQAYGRAIDLYAGSRAAAIQEMLGWTGDRLDLAMAVFDRSPGGQLPDVPAAFTAVMLHTDVALTAARLDRAPTAHLHLLTAALILERVDRAVPNQRQWLFSRAAWHIAVARALNGLWGWSTEESMLRALGGSLGMRGLDQVVDWMVSAARAEQPGQGAELLLALASLEEGTTQMERRTQRFAPRAGGRLAQRDEDRRRARLEQAERWYRRTLDLVPGLLEARLRLGALLLDRGRPVEARREITRVMATSGDVRQIYLACLFLGSMAEAEQRLDEASRFYEMALATWPQSRAARIALANVHEKLGDLAAARAQVLWFSESQSAGQVTDPWSGYLAGQVDEGQQALTGMRLLVTRRKE